jgi:D-alanyl-D-alanine carboxypeptidase
VYWGFAVALRAVIVRLRPLFLAATVAVGSFAGVGVAQPATVAAAGAPPACRYDDVLTEHRAYSDWNISVLDTTYALRKDYIPPGLESTRDAGLSGGGKVRSIVIGDLTAMAKAARKAGAALRVVSAYRSYSYQVALYKQEVRQYGETTAKHSVARPGHSEHQLGTTIDFGSASSGGGASQRFARTAAGKWMKANSWKYGWIMSYPAGKTSKTCYYYEPWHFRYVGVDEAAKVHASGLTLREYLWRHYQ